MADGNGKGWPEQQSEPWLQVLPSGAQLPSPLQTPLPHVLWQQLVVHQAHISGTDVCEAECFRAHAECAVNQTGFDVPSKRAIGYLPLIKNPEIGSERS